MKLKVKISKLTGNKIVVASLDNKFSEIQKLFTEYNVHHIPVVFDGKLIGIVSSNDLMKWYANEAHKLERIDIESIDNAITIEEIMTHNPITITSDDLLTTAIEILSTKKFQALPVVDDGKVVGMVTTRDVVKYVGRELKFDADSLF